MEEKKRCTVNARFTGPLKMVTDFGVSTEINWSALGVLNNLDWNAILVAFFVNVNKNSLISVRYL